MQGDMVPKEYTFKFKTRIENLHSGPAEIVDISLQFNNQELYGLEIAADNRYTDIELMIELLRGYQYRQLARIELDINGTK